MPLPTFLEEYKRNVRENKGIKTEIEGKGILSTPLPHELGFSRFEDSRTFLFLSLVKIFGMKLPPF